MSAKSSKKSKQDKKHTSRKMSKKSLDKVSGGISVKLGGNTNTSGNSSVGSDQC